MARNRIIKAKAFRSRDLCRVPIPARWTFAGLWTLADDKGRMEDDAEAICADLYLRDRDVTPEVVEDHLAMLAEAGVICRYTVDKRAYLHMPTWDKHQQVQHPSRTLLCPACPLDHTEDEGTLFPSNQWESHGALSEPSLSPHPKEKRREENKTLIPHDAETASSGIAVGRDQTVVVATTGFQVRRARVARDNASGESGRSDGLLVDADRMKAGKTRLPRTRLPRDFRPTPESVANVQRYRPDVDWQAETGRFRAYWDAQTGSRGEMADWQRTWRNWMRRARGGGPTDEIRRTGGMNWG